MTQTQTILNRSDIANLWRTSLATASMSSALPSRCWSWSCGKKSWPCKPRKRRRNCSRRAAAHRCAGSRRSSPAQEEVRSGQVRAEETACRRPARGLCGCGSATRGHPSARRTPSLSRESLRAHPPRAVRVGYRKSEAGRRRRTCICGEQQRRGAQSRTVEQTSHHLAAPPRPNLDACQEALNVATKVTTEPRQTVDAAQLKKAAAQGHRSGQLSLTASPQPRHRLREHCLA